MRARPLAALAAIAAAAFLAGCSGSGSAPAPAAPTAASTVDITINVTIDEAGRATVDTPSLGLGNPPEWIKVRFTSHHQPEKGAMGGCELDHDTASVNIDRPVALQSQDYCHTYVATVSTLPTVGTNYILFNEVVVGTFEVTVSAPTKTP